jgi:hypothetical protein
MNFKSDLSPSTATNFPVYSGELLSVNPPTNQYSRPEFMYRFGNNQAYQAEVEAAFKHEPPVIGMPTLLREQLSPRRVDWAIRTLLTVREIFLQQDGLEISRPGILRSSIKPTFSEMCGQRPGFGAQINETVNLITDQRLLTLQTTPRTTIQTLEQTSPREWEETEKYLFGYLGDIIHTRPDLTVLTSPGSPELRRKAALKELEIPTRPRLTTALHEERRLANIAQTIATRKEITLRRQA